MAGFKNRGVCLFSLWMEMRSKTMWRKEFETVELVTHWANTWVECRVGSWGEGSEELYWGLLKFRFGKVLTRTASKVLQSPAQQCVIRLKKFLHTGGHNLDTAAHQSGPELGSGTCSWCFCEKHAHSRADHLLKTFYWCLKQKLSYLSGAVLASQC